MTFVITGHFCQCVLTIVLASNIKPVSNEVCAAYHHEFRNPLETVLVRPMTAIS